MYANNKNKYTIAPNKIFALAKVDNNQINVSSFSSCLNFNSKRSLLNLYILILFL